MERLIDFFLEAGKLKRTKRTGWVQRGVRDAESVADHSWGSALIALALAKQLKADASKAVKMALVHDLAESKIGDIAPSDTARAKKRSLEKAALKSILANVKARDAKEIAELLSEYDSCRTRTAKLVRDAGNLDMLLQALEYERSQKVDLREFFRQKFLLPESRAIAKEIKARRRA